MAIPKRKDVMIRNRMKMNRKDTSNKECIKQFPDCPEIPNIEVKECKLCPFNKKLK